MSQKTAAYMVIGAFALVSGTLGFFSSYISDTEFELNRREVQVIKEYEGSETLNQIIAANRKINK